MGTFALWMVCVALSTFWMGLGFRKPRTTPEIRVLGRPNFFKTELKSYSWVLGFRLHYARRLGGGISKM